MLPRSVQEMSFNFPLFFFFFFLNMERVMNLCVVLVQGPC